MPKKSFKMLMARALPVDSVLLDNVQPELRTRSRVNGQYVRTFMTADFTHSVFLINQHEKYSFNILAIGIDNLNVT